MRRFDFESLDVYQSAILFAKEIYETTKRFPKEEAFGLTSQLRRAAMSISANIAEGHGRSRREALRYYGIARGSVSECIPLLTLAHQVGFLSVEEGDELRERCASIHRMLGGLSSSFSPVSPVSPVSPYSHVSPVSPGFTLVELLIVVTILGILVAMVVPRLAGRTEQARAARAEADVKGSISLALDMFELDTGKYPTSEQGVGALRTEPVGVTNWRGPYLKQDPTDPWGHPYRYAYPGKNNPKDYDLYSVGPDGSEGTSDDIGNWQQKR